MNTSTTTTCNNNLTRTTIKDATMATRQSRRRRGAIAAFLLAGCCTGVAAFSTPGPMTMRIDLGRKNVNMAKKTMPDPLRKESIRPLAGSPLGMICQDQNEFELSVGHAMDTLRSDYPDILTDKPDYSIYDPELEIIDPSGVKLHGVNNYKASFRLLHAIVGIFYCPERSGLTFRMCYDKARQNIRIHWNAQVIPKAIFGGVKTTLHVDGISVYELSRNSGNITQHRIERLVINDNPFMPEEGVFASLRGYAVNSKVDGIPSLNVKGCSKMADAVFGEDQKAHMVPFQNFVPLSRSILFSSGMGEGDEDSSLPLAAMSSLSSGSYDGNGDALEEKNLARKKFGLKPLTPEEYVDLQKQVAELDVQQQKRAAAYAAEMAKKKKDEEPGFMKKLFGKALENTCESNYDCESPEVCCDFVFKKMCCSSGMRILDGPPQSREGQLALIPVTADPSPYPPIYGRDGNQRY